MTGTSGSLAPAGGREMRVVATETHVPTRNTGGANISDGVSTGITSQLVHTISTATAAIRLVYSNHYNLNGVDTDTPNDITVKAALRINSTPLPVFFAGKRSVVIEPGATVMSDPIPVSYLKGNTVISRTWVSVTAGQRYPLGVTTDNVTGEGVATTDMTDSSTGIGASITKSYGPWAVVGTPRYPLGSNYPRVLTLGDSRVAGFGDTSGGRDAFGWVRRALDGKASYLNLGVSGSTAQANTPELMRRRLALADRCGSFDVAIVSAGINDLIAGASAATVQTRLQTIFDVLAVRGLRVYGATIPPVTTSSDSWATVGNQTPVASNAARITLNAWLRTTPAPLSGVFEFADAVESARDSGLWKAPGYTADGTHEAATGYTAEAALVTLASLGGAELVQ